ncbi:MAG: response regulator [Deltaproteobacteria bacterium]|nr:response regulator [Deltaproteobacteria bacterium]
MKTVLTVDDSRVARTAIAQVLSRWGCRVLEARDGREGVAVARLTRPDLILLDVLMPVLDGRQALAILRQDAGCRHLPVVMLTGITGESLVQQCSHLGISGYLVKPVVSDALLDVLGRVLGGPVGAPVAASSSDAPRPAMFG